MREIAIELIECVSGNPTEANIEGVLLVFNGVKDGCDLVWEEYIGKDVDQMLQINNFKCKRCSAPIKIERTSSTMYVTGGKKT